MSKFRNESKSERQIVACAHDGCADPAIIHLKVKVGFANVCRKHYEVHISQQGRDFNDRENLITRTQKKEFCLQHVPTFAQRSQRVFLGIREPGEEG